jgi:hypothetical protein
VGEQPEAGSGVTLAYDTAGLRAGAAGLQEVAGDTDAAGAALQGAPLESVMFGLTPGAAVFAAAMEAARSAQARGFRQEAQRSGDLGERGGTAAGLGDGLTEQTGTVARSATPSPR